MMKANEVRKMSSADLEKKLTELKKDLFQLRLQEGYFYRYFQLDWLFW